MHRHGHAEPTRVMLGAMIEVPALLFELDGLVKVADFRVGRDQRSASVHDRQRPQQRPGGAAF